VDGSRLGWILTERWALSLRRVWPQVREPHVSRMNEYFWAE
jgi:hypothetical protein